MAEEQKTGEAKVSYSKIEFEDSDSESEEVKWPEVEDPKSDKLFPTLKSRASLLNILSYLHIHDLTRLLKVNRFAYRFIINYDNRKNILQWKMPKQDQDKITDYIIDMWSGQTQ